LNLLQLKDALPDARAGLAAPSGPPTMSQNTARIYIAYVAKPKFANIVPVCTENLNHHASFSFA
jgi:hypothetical protein